jgi:hypothetical protein
MPGRGARCGAKPLRPLRVERAQPRDAVGGWRLRREQRRKAARRERVDREERRRGRVGTQFHELGRLLEPNERVGEPVRRLADRGGERVGDELALRREQGVDDRRRDRSEHEQQGAREEPADAAQLDERRSDDDRRRLDEHVARADVGDLVREHALELGGRQRLQ